MNGGIQSRGLAQGYARGRQHIRQLLEEQHAAEQPPETGPAENPTPDNPPAPKPGLRLHELPDPLLHTACIELARIFCQRLGRPRANDLELAGFTSLSDLLLRGWILREPGRYSIGYMPGAPVIREMWHIDPTLCSLLKLPHPGDPAGQGNSISQ